MGENIKGLLRHPTWNHDPYDALETCQEFCRLCVELWRQPVPLSCCSHCLKRRTYCLISLGNPLVWKGLETKHKWAGDTKNPSYPFLIRTISYFYILPQTARTVTHAYRFV